MYTIERQNCRERYDYFFFRDQVVFLALACEQNWLADMETRGIEDMFDFRR